MHPVTRDAGARSSPGPERARDKNVFLISCFAVDIKMLPTWVVCRKKAELQESA